jgi:hypothetical protein
MTETNYQKTGRTVVGYDNTGFICVIDIYQDFNNPKADFIYKADGKEVIKVNEQTYRIVETGRTINVG